MNDQAANINSIQKLELNSYQSLIGSESQGSSDNYSYCGESTCIVSRSIISESDE